MSEMKPVAWIDPKYLPRRREGHTNVHMTLMKRGEQTFPLYTGEQLSEAVAQALYEQNVGLTWHDDADREEQVCYRYDARIVLAAADAAAWRPIESAPKDMTPILAKIHDDLFPRVKPTREDLARWNGRYVVIKHEHLPDDGFDIGWGMDASVGYGGMPDEWFSGWMPLPAAPKEAGHD